MTDAIRANSVVSLDYTLKGDDGEVIDSSEGKEALYYLHGHGNIVPGLENALTGKSDGDSVDVVVPPAEGYGEYDAARVIEVPRDRLPDDMEPKKGEIIGMQTPDGHTMPVTIAEVSEDQVKLDANHALAGATLHFSVKVVSVRDATPEELTHGHVHGPGGAHD